jgi:hypothetical protein
MVGTEAREVERGAGLPELCRSTAAVGSSPSACRASPRQPRAPSSSAIPLQRMSCGSTHVLLAADCVRRRRDGVEVIGAALVAKAAGHGHRRAARELNDRALVIWRRGVGTTPELVRSSWVTLALGGLAWAGVMCGGRRRSSTWRCDPAEPNAASERPVSAAFAASRADRCGVVPVNAEPRGTGRAIWRPCSLSASSTALRHPPQVVSAVCATARRQVCQRAW